MDYTTRNITVFDGTASSNISPDDDAWPTPSTSDYAIIEIASTAAQSYMGNILISNTSDSTSFAQTNDAVLFDTMSLEVVIPESTCSGCFSQWFDSSDYSDWISPDNTYSYSVGTWSGECTAL